MFTTIDFFKGELVIAGRGDSNVVQMLDKVIAVREPQYLELVMGYECYKTFKDAIAVNDPEQRWKDIRDGVDFRDTTGRLRKWIGFSNTEKISPIANYVFFFYQRAQQSFSTGVGEVGAKSNNATAVDPSIKLYEAWNTCSEMTDTLQLLLKSKDESGLSVYPEFDYHFAERIKKTSWI